MEKIKNLFELTRAYALGETFASCFIILAYSHFSNKFSIFNFIILTVALCCVHLGANLFDDYLDIKMKLKDGTPLKDIVFNSFIPTKARLIINETFSLRQTEMIILLLFFIPLCIGFYFTYISGFKILIYMLLGGTLALFYPIAPRYYLGEIVIGLIYGPLMITGGHYALTGEFSYNLLFISISIFFTTVTLLHTDNLMDWEFDIKEKRNTLCVLSGSKEKSLKLLKYIIIASYFIIVSGVLLKEFNPKMLYVFLTLPIATKLLESMKDYINIKDVKFKPRWYWGFFENWKQIEELNIAFYMFRFYLARNFSFFFAVFAAIGIVE